MELYVVKISVSYQFIANLSQKKKLGHISREIWLALFAIHGCGSCLKTYKQLGACDSCL
jgi:hypothetical protein